MKATLKHLLLDCLSDIQKSNSGADPLKYPSQILCLAESITFTERCEKAIHSNNLEGLLSSLKVRHFKYYITISLFICKANDTSHIKIHKESIYPCDILHKKLSWKSLALVHRHCLFGDCVMNRKIHFVSHMSILHLTSVNNFCN